MQFDKIEHKQLVEEMIKNTNFPGQIAELVVDLKQAVIRSEVKPVERFGVPMEKSGGV